MNTDLEVFGKWVLVEVLCMSKITQGITCKQRIKLGPDLYEKVAFAKQKQKFELEKQSEGVARSHKRMML